MRKCKPSSVISWPVACGLQCLPCICMVVCCQDHLVPYPSPILSFFLVSLSSYVVSCLLSFSLPHLILPISLCHTIGPYCHGTPCLHAPNPLLSSPTPSTY